MATYHYRSPINISNGYSNNYKKRKQQDESIIAYNRCLRLFRWPFVLSTMTVILLTIIFNTQIVLVALERWHHSYKKYYENTYFLIDNVHIKMSMALIMSFSGISVIIYLIGLISIVRERLDWLQLFSIFLTLHSFTIYVISNQYWIYLFTINCLLLLITLIYILLLVKKILLKQKFHNLKTIPTKTATTIDGSISTNIFNQSSPTSTIHSTITTISSLSSSSDTNDSIILSSKAMKPIVKNKRINKSSNNSE